MKHDSPSLGETVLTSHLDHATNKEASHDMGGLDDLVFESAVAKSSPTQNATAAVPLRRWL